MKVVVLYGSRADVEFAEPARALLRELGVRFEERVASAHKTPDRLLRMLEEYERSGEELVYLTFAGRSNALSGMVDAQVRHPVIACPVKVESFPLDIFSSLRMPKGVAPLVVMDPEGAALAAAKILSLLDRGLAEKLSSWQRRRREEVLSADESAVRGWR
ncbi:MAG: AIR carboxylase family protein [Candidatus Hadarchaeales archaeon]